MTSHRPSKLQLGVATMVVSIVVLVVWKYIDYQTQPPPPPNKVATPAPVP